jgi:hypothetical protein
MENSGRIRGFISPVDLAQGIDQIRKLPVEAHGTNRIQPIPDVSLSFLQHIGSRISSILDLDARVVQAAYLTIRGEDGTYPTDPQSDITVLLPWTVDGYPDLISMGRTCVQGRLVDWNQGDAIWWRRGATVTSSNRNGYVYKQALIVHLAQI